MPLYEYPGMTDNRCNGCGAEIDEAGYCQCGWNHFIKQHDSDAVFVWGTNESVLSYAKPKKPKEKDYPGRSGNICMGCFEHISTNDWTCGCGWNHFTKQRILPLKPTPKLPNDKYPGTIMGGKRCAGCLRPIDPNSICPCGWDHKTKKKKS